VRGALAAFLIALTALLVSLTGAAAQRQPVDPRVVSLTPADLPRDFAVVESETTFEPLRIGEGQTDADVVGVTFMTAMERSRSLEHLQSGPVRVTQMIARSDDPARATFSLAAQRDYNLREHGYEVVAATVPDDELLCLLRHVGPLVEYRIDAVRHENTLVSTTVTGLPSAISLDGAIALSTVSLARYDQQLGELLAAQPPPAAMGSLGTDIRAVATVTPTPMPTPVPPPAPPMPGMTPTAEPTALAATAPLVKLPAHVDGRLAQPWSELMSSTATTSSGAKMAAFLRQVVDKADLDVRVGALRSNVGGELRSVANVDGGTLKIVSNSVTINSDVMSESPRVLAAILAHEITHANQSLSQSRRKAPDCVEAEVDAYAVQARVWSAFWDPAHGPSQTTWERSMDYVVEVWKDGGEDGLRSMVREETGTNAHSCTG